MKTFHELLIELKACGYKGNTKSVLWAGDKTIEEVVATCHRGDWLFWLAERIDIDKRLLTLEAGHSAATVLHLMTEEDSRKGVQAAIDYGEGRITEEELVKAAAAAANASAYANAAAAAAANASASVSSAYAAKAAAYVAAKSAYASYATSYVAANAAAFAEKENQMATADICRKYIGDLIIKKVNELLNQPK